jgi:hypothetical protein
LQPTAVVLAFVAKQVACLHDRLLLLSQQFLVEVKHTAYVLLPVLPLNPNQNRLLKNIKVAGQGGQLFLVVEMKLKMWIIFPKDLKPVSWLYSYLCINLCIINPYSRRIPISGNFVPISGNFVPISGFLGVSFPKSGNYTKQFPCGAVTLDGQETLSGQLRNQVGYCLLLNP